MQKKAKNPSNKKSVKEEQLFQNLLKVTHEFIKGKRYKPLSKESLIEKLRIHEDHLELFDTILKELKEAGSVREHSNKYMPYNHDVAVAEEKEEEIFTKGKLTVHPRGFGFVLQEDGSSDIFIPKPHIGNAIDGDIVQVIVSKEISEKGPEGKIVKILERGKKEIVGTVIDILPESYLIYSLQPGQMRNISAKKEKNLPVHIGDRVILALEETSKKENPVAHIVKKIGNVEDPRSDVPFAAHEHGIIDTFSEDVLNEAQQFGSRVQKKDLIGRKDLRDSICVTIDPTTAKDFDDAISLEESDDHFVLGVHIADVSYYVTPGSLLDVEASRRCNSTYFPHLCIPMLPHELSSHLCSLKEGVLRLTVTVMMQFDKEGNLLNTDVFRSVIKSSKRFTYAQAKEVLDDKRKSVHKPLLDRMVRFCHLLKAKRRERGSVELYMPELLLLTDADGKPLGTEIIAYDITHQMIEEFMLKANEVIAKRLSSMGRAISFRVHEEPAKESLRDLSSLANAFGYTLDPDPTPHDIQNFFNDVGDSPYAQYLATCYIKSMRLASYAADNIGHYGLSLEHYCHFTSPIRRYADVIVHRQIFAEKPLDKVSVHEICLTASEKERISARAEGLVHYIKKLRLLKMYQDQEPLKQYEAVITKVKPYGIHFDVLEFMMDGSLHISEIGDDFFVFDEFSKMLLGRYTGTVIQSGNKIFVQIKNIDLIQQELSWKMARVVEENISEERMRDFIDRPRKPFKKKKRNGPRRSKKKDKQQ